MIPLVAGLLTALAKEGLTTLVSAIQAKGKQVVEDKLGVTIPDDPAQLTPELIATLRQKEIDHEEFLIQTATARYTADLEAEKVATQEVTKRWQADMLSDSYLSKNIRPLCLAGTLIFLAFAALLSLGGLQIGEAYLRIFDSALQVMIGAYFVGRTVEKGIDVYQGWKQTKGE